MSGKPIQLSALSIEELASLRQQTQREVETLSQSLQALEVAVSRYMDSKECVSQIKKSYEGVETLIPLTSSLFVPANLEHTDTVLIDIGANYYATKSVGSAKDYFDRHIATVNGNIEKVRNILANKYSLLDGINDTIYMKQKA